MHPSYANQSPAEQARHDEIVRRERLSILIGDGGRVPCSRYGHDAESCAPVALAVAEIVAETTGEPITSAALDHSMSLVVNDHDDPLYLIREYGSDDQRALVSDLIEE